MELWLVRPRVLDKIGDGIRVSAIAISAALERHLYSEISYS
jgi:hypothetical protein